ncbi:MAG: transcriptional regulator [Nitrospirae bacterium CG_4_10_14_0_8_um_filter_41_23]|nr:winged helix-turn-helix transcriptional regulator [Nitrospirota bacterium]PIQ94243.1 MAG: transcriptional regulator [Nitrospirae bacterium CG11_big_fil_rev_8_21_14_0_20_41_14]PIV43860.1 MAG: transcriptional regulator [Nitrospirae bacterium CG02_land_8_20_14_3_00_41_53]PIW88296.1 MAG: transcriptional regulator [Nitrospirae bacterium CG_4_8_14_3_um_filter_41_47]PIY86445.1 MAG: transcriptional regulator [Nitrospirae bacterium CG_4_10_14_0_8_um_filter_41_23]PJA79785.1 MAG: transcriptional regul
MKSQETPSAFYLDNKTNEWYVHIMNNQKKRDGSHRSLHLLEELSRGDAVTQRELSSKLGVALGLVNSYIKNLVSKGYITVKAVPPKRYAYYLTPKGFAEKTRLTYHHLQNFTNLYREARRDFKELFNRLYIEGVKSVVFAGADEAAEIAYLSLQEFDIKFAGIVDNERTGKDFFKYKIMPFEKIKEIDADFIIVSSFFKRDEIYKKLMEADITPEKIKSIFPVSFEST